MTDLHEDLRHALATQSDESNWLRRLVSGERVKPAVIVCAVFLVLATSATRLLAGPDLRFYSLTYTAAVLLAAWFAGRRAGTAIAIFCSLTWLVSDFYSPHFEYQHKAMAFVNAAIRLGMYVLAAQWISALGDLTTRLEGVVEERTRALRRLASELSEAEDRERRRLAHDIHDGFSQMLSVLKLNLAAAKTAAPQPVATEPTATAENAAAPKLDEALHLVDELIQRSRTLMFDLHPSMLDHFGLVATLRHFSEQFNRQTGVEVTVNEEGSPRALPEVAANYLFRSVKELISNAAKHGRAKQIVVSIYWIPTGLRVVVDDDGSGFSPAEVFARGGTKGLGLAAINERLRSFGGSLRLDSSPGTGTRVVMEFPQNG